MYCGTRMKDFLTWPAGPDKGPEKSGFIYTQLRFNQQS
jgi:hypothetical protein